MSKSKKSTLLVPGFETQGRRHQKSKKTGISGHAKMTDEIFFFF